MKRLRPGDVVEVKTVEEISRGLDSRGCRDGLPFMPEMLPSCGRRYRVWRRVEKTCIETDGFARLRRFVFIDEVRCDGSGHDGCSRLCPCFFHEDWLTRVDGEPDPPESGAAGATGALPYPTRLADGTYVCQSTELPKATTPLPWYQVGQYVRDVLNGTWGPWQMVRFCVGPAWSRLVRKVKGEPNWLRGPCRTTPTEALGLQAGEIVEVKSAAEILQTLDGRGRNRGMEFTPLMLPFCGKTFRVLGRADRLILELSGRMVEMQNTVILDGVICDGFTRMGGCPRAVYHMGREIWLRRA